MHSNPHPTRALNLTLPPPLTLVLPLSLNLHLSLSLTLTRPADTLKEVATKFLQEVHLYP